MTYIACNTLLNKKPKSSNRPATRSELLDDFVRKHDAISIDDMNKQQTKDLEFKSVNQAKYSKRMSITSNSLGRLIEDYYTDLSCFEYKVNMSDSCCFIEKNKLKDLPSKAISDKVGSSQRELDLEIVSKSISKYLCTWWS